MTDLATKPAALDAKAFEREERYIVIKRKHLTPFMEGAIRNQLSALEVPTVECAVVESDWPEYEPVWQMIEARVSALVPRADMDEAVGLLREAEGHVEYSHDEGCETDLDYGESAFDMRMKEEDPDGERDDVWPKDAVCDCGTDPLAHRISAFLARHDASDGGGA